MTAPAPQAEPGSPPLDLVIVGAGPCGLAAAVSAQRAGLRAVVFDAAAVVSTITQYPTYVTFFSTAEKLSIGGLPFVVAAEKPTRRDALAYYRAAVRHFAIPVRQYERVIQIAALGERPSDRPDDAAEAPGGRRGRRPTTGAPAADRRAARAPRGAANGGPPPDDTIASAAASRIIETTPGGAHHRPPRYAVRTRSQGGEEREALAHAVVIATGYFGSPNRLRVPGEDLPHVTHVYREGHEAFLQDAVVVGGGNSAAEAALDLWRCGARVTVVHFGPTFDKRIKPWVLPDVTNRMAERSIAAAWNSRVREITPREVVLDPTDGTLFGAPTTRASTLHRVPASRVYVMTGFAPNVDLLRQVGVTIDPATGIPAHQPETLETDVPGIFIAGVVVAGYDANKVFIENGRFHGDRIVARLLRRPAPPEPSLSAELRSGEHP